MKMKAHVSLLLLSLLILACSPKGNQDKSQHQNFEKKSSMSVNSSTETETYTRKEIIYGRTYGTALTMDVFAPKKNANGLGIVLFISEGWYSEREKIEYNIPIYVDEFIKHGYTVFAVIHGSNPKFSLQENYEHAKRAVRFIRHHAASFGIHANKLGATGDSAGGHLSLLVGSDESVGDTSSDDPVEKESCKVQCVVAFFPPTDFFNWGKPNQKMLGKHPKVSLKGAFTFYELDSSSNSLQVVTDVDKITRIVKKLTPIEQVNERTSPTLIVYGDKDSFIPIQQSQALSARLQQLHVPTKTIVEKGGEHDEATIKNNISETLVWFDEYLKK
jgi:acetyl esterase/lipase